MSRNICWFSWWLNINEYLLTTYVGCGSVKYKLKYIAFPWILLSMLLLLFLSRLLSTLPHQVCTVSDELNIRWGFISAHPMTPDWPGPGIRSLTRSKFLVCLSFPCQCFVLEFRVNLIESSIGRARIRLQYSNQGSSLLPPQTYILL